MVVTDAALAVDEIMCRPVFVAEGLPDFVVAVDGDRISDFQAVDGLVDVGAFFFECEFGGVNADYYQAGFFILRGPAFDVGQSAEAVDAGVCPEVYHYYFAAELVAGKRRGI